MQNYRSPLPLFAALLLLFSFASCKKEEDPNGTAAPFALEKLGDLTLNKGEICYNLEGEPLIQVNSFLYEWSNTGKAWKKVGGAVSARTITNGVKQCVQDKRGVYYMCDGDFIYSCATATDNWVPVTFPGITVDGTRCALVANDLGDIVVMVKDIPNVYRYFSKKGTAAVWTLLISIPQNSLKNEFPFFLCNNGILYLSEWGGRYPNVGTVADKYLDTNTGRFASLYDKSDPANVPLGGTGYIIAPYMQIHSSGIIYMLRENNELFKLDGAVLPAKMAKVRTFEHPLAGKHDRSWTNSLGEFSINDAGDIKTMGSCNRYPNTHWSHLSGNINRSDMKVHQEEAGQRSMYVNRKNECFLLMYPNTGMYKWN